MVAVYRSGCTKKAVIALIFSTHFTQYLTCRSCLIRNQIDYTRDGIRTIDHAGRAFHDLNLADCVFIHLYSMFVTPLLPLLPDTIHQSQNPVKSHSMNEWL